MKKIYVNLLGNWTLLTRDDLICNCDPHTWVKEKNIQEFSFINVVCKEQGYQLHISQLQVVD